MRFGPATARACRRSMGPASWMIRRRASPASRKRSRSSSRTTASFYPYSSKYDAYLAGKATLTPQEARGLELFNEPTKGNCAACHISQRGNDGTPPQFTDFGLIAIGVPRNPAIPANADPDYVDLGLCGPLRTDLQDRADYCGLFRTPTCATSPRGRPSSTTAPSTTCARSWSSTSQRDTNPERWYPRGPDGSVRKFDDLPAIYHANINLDPPFDRQPGEAPALSAAEIDDVVAFLRTLTDGYSEADIRPARAAARRRQPCSGICRPADPARRCHASCGRRRLLHRLPVVERQGGRACRRMAGGVAARRGGRSGPRRRCERCRRCSASCRSTRC